MTSIHPSEHTALLAESVADFVRRATDVARVRRLRDAGGECDRDQWRSLAGLGWLGILVPERFGGMGLGLTEAAIVAEGLARGLVPEPFTATAVLAVSVLAGGDNEALKEELLPQIVAGTLLPAVAWQERAGELDPHAVDAVATSFEGGFRLSGTKQFIAAAADADAFLVSARHAGGLAVFWVKRDTAGARLQPVARSAHDNVAAHNDVQCVRLQVHVVVKRRGLRARHAFPPAVVVEYILIDKKAIHRFRE